MIELKTKCRNCEHPVSLQMMEFGDPLPPEAAADESMRDALKSWIWTTEPPKEPGWYFISNKRMVGPAIVYLRADGLVEIVGSARGRQHKEKITHWLGPLPVPEPPKE